MCTCSDHVHRLAASSLTTCGPKILVAKSANRVSNRTGSLARVPKKTDYGLCQPETLRIETANRERSPRLDLRVTFPSTLPFYLRPLLPNSFSSFVAFPFLSALFLARRYPALLSFIDFTVASKTLSVLFFAFLFRRFPSLSSILRLPQSRLSLVSSFLFSLFSCLYAFAFFFTCFTCTSKSIFTRSMLFLLLLVLPLPENRSPALFHHSFSLLFSRWIFCDFSLSLSLCVYVFVRCERNVGSLSGNRR